MADAAAHHLRAAAALLSILAGLGVVALLPLFDDDLRGVTRFLVGWDVGVGLYLVLALRMIATSTVTHIHRQSLLQDEGFAILVLTIISAAASVGAVFAWLESAHRLRRSRLGPWRFYC